MTEPLAWAMVGAAVLSLGSALFALWRSTAALLGARSIDPLPEEPLEQWLERLDEERARLLERKRVVLRGLRDVRAERDAGRMDAEAAEALEARLKRRYGAVLAELEAQLGEHWKEADRLFEAALGAAPQLVSKPSEPDSAEGGDAPPRCGGCGTLNDADARFCKRCGEALSSEDAAEPGAVPAAERSGDEQAGGERSGGDDAPPTDVEGAADTRGAPEETEEAHP